MMRLMSQLGMVFGLMVAQASWALQWLPGAGPDVVVKANDSIWEIASRTLDEPWRWSEIPTLKGLANELHPGDVLRLGHTSNGLSIRRVSLGTPPVTLTKVRLSPEIREIARATLIPKYPKHLLKPLADPLMIISSQQLDSSPVIRGFSPERLLGSTGDTVITTGASLAMENPIAQKTTLQSESVPVPVVVRPIQSLKRRQGGNPLGLLVEPVATLQPSPKHPVYDITSVRQEVLVGDAIALQPLPVSLPEVPRVPALPASGDILAIHPNLSQAGQFDRVVISGGGDQHRVVGDVLKVVTPVAEQPKRFSRKSTLNRQPIDSGLLLVTQVFDAVSVGVVLQSQGHINLQSEVEAP